jgi:hypothetical protein
LKHQDFNIQLNTIDTLRKIDDTKLSFSIIDIMTYGNAGKMGGTVLSGNIIT